MTARRTLPGVLWTSDLALQIASGFIPDTAAGLEKYADAHGGRLHLSLGPDRIPNIWSSGDEQPFIPKSVEIKIERHVIMGCAVWAIGMSEADEKVAADHFATMQLDTRVARMGAA
jgi:hypothetical protein